MCDVSADNIIFCYQPGFGFFIQVYMVPAQRFDHAGIQF